MYLRIKNKGEHKNLVNRSGEYIGYYRRSDGEFDSMGDGWYLFARSLNIGIRWFEKNDDLLICAQREWMDKKCHISALK